MDPAKKEFLTLRVIPACLTQQETAWYLGIQLHNIPTLVSAGVITPLGHPKQNSTKFFALAELECLRVDIKRLSRVIGSIQAGWERKNRNKTAGQGSLQQANYVATERKERLQKAATAAHPNGHVG